MKKIRRKVIFAKRKQAVYEIYGTYNLCITSVQYSKKLQNSIVEKN